MSSINGVLMFVLPGQGRVGLKIGLNGKYGNHSTEKRGGSGLIFESSAFRAED